MTRRDSALPRGCLMVFCMYAVVVAILYLDGTSLDKEFRSVKVVPAMSGQVCNLRSALANRTHSCNIWPRHANTTSAPTKGGGDDTGSLTTPSHSQAVPGYFFLDSDEPFKLRCGRCALVASSGHLYHSGAGVDIDRADCVLRMNTAPVIGWTEDVGSRTDIRIIGHRNLPRDLFRNRKLQREILKDKATRASYIVIPWLYEAEINMTSDKTVNAARKLKKLYPYVNFVFLTKEKHNESETRFLLDTGMRRTELNTWFSTGFVSMVFALDVCKSVQVFGLPDSDFCRNRTGNDTHEDFPVPYHYYEPKGATECHCYIKHEKKVTGHRFSTERAIFARWSLQTNIEFLYPSWTAPSQNLTGHLDTEYLREYKYAMEHGNHTDVQKKRKKVVRKVVRRRGSRRGAHH